MNRESSHNEGIILVGEFTGRVIPLSAESAGQPPSHSGSREANEGTILIGEFHNRVAPLTAACNSHPAEESQDRKLVSLTTQPPTPGTGLTWEQELVQRGAELGDLRTARASLLIVLRSRFSLIPPEVEQRIQGLDSLTQLFQLVEAAAGVKSLDEMHWETPRPDSAHQGQA